jgi:uncharacterized protein
MVLCAGVRAVVAAGGHGPRLLGHPSHGGGQVRRGVLWRWPGGPPVRSSRFRSEWRRAPPTDQPWSQARGYRDAIGYGNTLEGVDRRRVALWGDSLSGGVALAVAGIDDRVAALAVQVPAIGAQPPPLDPGGSLYWAFRETLLSGVLEPCSEDVQGPLPVVSDDQVRRPSLLQPLTAYRWFIDYGGRLGTGWVNDVTRARPKTPVGWHPALCARYVSCPSLFVVSPEDEMPGSVPAVARDAYEQLAGPKEWLAIAGGHFGLLYVPSPEFEQASSAQARFVAEHLLARGRTGPGAGPPARQ